MSSTSSVSSSTRLRATGLISGLDVDALVEQLMSAEKTRLNKLKQQEQLAEWKQEQYRNIINDIKTFSDKYFSLTASASLLSQKNFQKFTVTSSNSAIAATAGTNAVNGTHKLKVSQLATAATVTSSSRLTKDVQGMQAADFTAAQGKSFVINLDGTDQTVTIDSGVTDVASLQTAIDTAVGKGKVTLSTDATTGALVFAATANSGIQKITLSDTSDSALSDLGFGSGAILSNRISTTDTLGTLANQFSTALTFTSDGEIELTINGSSFSFDKSDTLSNVIKAINQDSTAGVTLKYDEISDKLILTADRTGAGSTLEVSETGSNFLAVALDSKTEGKDAQLTLDDQLLTRSTNTVTVDGVTYTFSDTTDSEARINVSQDTDGIYENIVNFVNDYNTLIGTLNNKISEQYDYDYPPLTDDEKEALSDDEIEIYETKAKAGLLEDDPLIQNLVDNLRRALLDSVSGQSTGLAAIGITTSNYEEKGKLHIDEDTLKQAIQDDPEAIMNLFTQESTSYSGTVTVRNLAANERKIRYNEEGLAYRFYDILQDNIGTLRDSYGNKGWMLEKAGLEGDTTDTDNSMTRDLAEILEAIEEEEERLDDYEESLYDKYTSLETSISTMNSQLSSLLSALGSE